MSIVSLIKSLLEKMSGDTLMVRSLNSVLVPKLNSISRSLPAGALVVDIGAKNSIYRNLFYGKTFLTLDVVADHGPDIVGDVHALVDHIDEGSVDLIICTEVLEHVRDPHLAIEQIRRVLRPGGTLLASTPFIVPYHPDPTDYWRMTSEGWSVMTESFGRSTVTAHGNRWLSLWYLAAAGILLPLRLLDRFVFFFLKGPDRYAPLGFVCEAIR